MFNSHLFNASIHLHRYLEDWYGGKWTVIYYMKPFGGYTSYSTNNICSVDLLQKGNATLKVWLFQHMHAPVLSTNISCDYWLTSMEIKIRRFGKLQTATSEIFHELQIHYPENYFTVVCGKHNLYGLMFTVPNYCSYVRPDNTSCFIYQH